VAGAEDGFTAVVVAGGDPGGSVAWGTALLAGAELVVAADGGAQTAVAWGRYPDVVAGDLDSLDAGRRAALAAQGCAFETYPRDKDQTDTEIALLLARNRGAAAIRVAGALGGPRFDHALANVMLLALPELTGADVALVGERHEVRLLRGPGAVQLAGWPGDVVTLLPLGSRTTGVTTEGLRYPLREGALALGRSRGVSNALTGDVASITLRRGRLLVVLHRLAPPAPPLKTQDLERV
jgi:thiamine pyrophosphokinase